MRLQVIIKLLLIFTLSALLFGCSGGGANYTADEIVNRSFEAHGGMKLTGWNSLTIEGRIWMKDGVWFDAKYLAFAEKPGKLRVEHDMTFAKGRRFTEYFMNDGLAWSRRNLVVGRGNTRQMNRWWNQLNGIGYYKENSLSFELKENSEVDWREASDIQKQNYETVDTTPAFVVAAIMEQDTVDLYFDKKSFYLIREVNGNTTRTYHEFKTFDGVVMPTKINSIVISTTRSGETRTNITPYFYEEVRFNAAIEGHLFTEDMPEKR